jgi:hypothetical protein
MASDGTGLEEHPTPRDRSRSLATSAPTRATYSRTWPRTHSDWLAPRARPDLPYRRARDRRPRRPVLRRPRRRLRRAGRQSGRNGPRRTGTGGGSRRPRSRRRGPRRYTLTDRETRLRVLGETRAACRSDHSAIMHILSVAAMFSSVPRRCFAIVSPVSVAEADEGRQAQRPALP